MSDEPRHEDDYEPRQVAAAKRVIVDVMQVLEFHNETDESVREEQARRAFELVNRFLAGIEQVKSDE